MKTAMICFTKKGADLAQRLTDACQAKGWEVLCCSTKEGAGVQTINVSLSDWVKEQFEQTDLLIFVGACGIAVRSIAPYIQSKATDPAVIVVDELGQHMISLLSGHLGGANEWTNELASCIFADPVITTASDLNGKIAVDVLAKQNHCVIYNLNTAKKVESAILEGQKIGFFCESTIEGNIPDYLVPLSLKDGRPHAIESIKSTEITRCEIEKQITIGLHKPESDNTLWMIPKVLTIGIGCKKGIPKEKIKQAVQKQMEQLKLPISCIKQIVTIDLKQKEEGLIGFCDLYELPLRCFSSEELSKVAGEFQASEFVQKVTGVDNVCERAAVLGSDYGTLLVGKQAMQGVTIAIAVEEWRIHFE